LELFEAIRSRRSIGKVKPDPVGRDLIEAILSAGVQAPNHHTVRPWRFVVLTGAARERLGSVMAASLLARAPETPAGALDAERAKFLRAPLLIAVGVDRPDQPKVDEIENLCAAAAAAQNMLLAAQGLGLAAIWRTGPAAGDPGVKAFLGLAPEQRLIAFLYIGYPLNEPTAPQRPGFEDRTTWLE
jgi:nitroreductase